MTRDICLPQTLDSIKDLQHKLLQQLHLLVLHLEIEGYTTLLLYLFLQLLSTGDLKGERRTLKLILKMAESETQCNLSTSKVLQVGVIIPFQIKELEVSKLCRENRTQIRPFHFNDSLGF